MAFNELRDIRRVYDIHQVLQRAGAKHGKRRMVCPLPHHQHRHNTPSFSIFHAHDGSQRFQCHGNCGAHGDVIDLAGYLWVPNYNPEDPKTVRMAIDNLTTKTNFSVEIAPPKRVRIDPLMWRKYLPIRADGREYAHSRGLNDETIRRFRLGQDANYLTIPAFTEGRLMGIKKRAIGPARLRYIAVTGSRQSIFNHDAVAYATGPLFLVKGEIPAMLLDQHGYKACAPTGGEAGWDPKWVQLFALGNVIVIGDNDATGVEYGNRRARELGGLAKFPPEQFKDIDKWFLADPELVQRTLKQWAEEAAHGINL